MKALAKRQPAKLSRKIPAEEEVDTGGVRSVDRAMALLEVLGEDEEGYRLTDLAVRTGLSTSSVHRLLTTLEMRRFVQFDHSDGMWHVGQRTFSVGSAFARRRNFVAPALPFLRSLRDLTRETANLGVIDNGEVVVLTQVESREIMRAITMVGGRAPMITSGMGKAILSTYSQEDVDAIIQRHGMRRLTPKSLVRAGKLLEELQHIRQVGYAVDDEEFLQGLRCVAAVVYNHHGEALAAISISGITTRVDRARLPALGELVRDTAARLTAALGGSKPAGAAAQTIAAAAPAGIVNPQPA